MTTEWTTDEEAAALHKRFDDLKRAGGGQADFARKWEIPGGASMVSQHIKARRPISIEAAIAYAAGFGCTVSEISPRLAKTIDRGASITEHAQATSAQEATITRGGSANTPPALAQTLADLSAYLERLDIDDRAEAMKMIAVLTDKPERHSKVAASIEGMVAAAFAQSRKSAA